MLLFQVGLLAVFLGCWQCWQFKKNRRNRALEVSIRIVPTSQQPPTYTASISTRLLHQAPDMTSKNVDSDVNKETGAKLDNSDAVDKTFVLDSSNNTIKCNIRNDSGIETNGKECDVISGNRDDNTTNAESKSGVKT